MCQGALLWAEIPLVVYGTSIERLQQMGWKQIDIYANEVARRVREKNPSDTSLPMWSSRKSTGSLS